MVLAGSACVPRETLSARGELAVEAGVPLSLASEGPGAWDFGDGTTAGSARIVSHAWARAGRYRAVATVRGHRDEWTVVVAPRPIVHAIPPDAVWAIFGVQPDSLPQAVDGVERVLGPGTVRTWLEVHPLQGWALEATGGVLDPGEGIGLFAWPDAELATVACAGVLDDAAAIAGFRDWLGAHDWAFVSEVSGLLRFEREERALDVLVDRGVLFAIESPLLSRVPSAQSRLAAAPTSGLEFDPAVAAALDGLPSGSVVTWRRLGARQLVATLRFESSGLAWEGRLSGTGPAWATADAGSSPPLLGNAPQGAVLLGSTEASLGEVGLLLAPGGDLPELLPGLGALAGRAELAVYFDVEAFVRATLAGAGLPEPRGLLLLEAGVGDPAKVRPLIDALVARWELPLQRANDTWAGQVRGMPITVRLTGSRLSVRAGADGTPRPLVDLRASLAEEALAPGHLVLRLDVARLRQELLLPRRLEGVDPRRALVAQAAAVTVIDRLTRVDTATLQLHPDERGARFELTLTFRPVD